MKVSIPVLNPDPQSSTHAQLDHESLIERRNPLCTCILARALPVCLCVCVSVCTHTHTHKHKYTHRKENTTTNP